MPTIGVNIDADVINKFISDAILKSVIGEQINIIIRERLSDYNFKNTIGKVIDTTISQLVYKILNEDHGEIMRKAVLEKVSGEVVSELVGKALDNWLSTKV